MYSPLAFSIIWVGSPLTSPVLSVLGESLSIAKSTSPTVSRSFEYIVSSVSLETFSSIVVSEELESSGISSREGTATSLSTVLSFTIVLGGNTSSFSSGLKISLTTIMIKTTRIQIKTPKVRPLLPFPLLPPPLEGISS